MTDGGWLAGGPLFGLPLPEIWFGLMFFILGMFLFLDGFDFGVGALFATREDEHDRETLLSAIGPFWDGNEVWLVLFGGAMFAAFPRVYANLFSRHYLLMFAILGALILRGVAPEMYEQRHDDRWKRWWGRSFVVGSVGAPFFLGVFAANWLIGATSIVTLPGILVGLALVALTVVDGVAFLRLKTRGSLQQNLARDGYLALGAYLVLVVLSLVAIYVTTPALQAEMLSVPIVGLVVATVLLAGVYAYATREDLFYVAFAAGAVMVFGLVAVVAVLLYPSVDPVTGLTVSDAIVSTLPLNIMTVGTALLMPLVMLYFVVLYSAFGGPVEAGEAY